MSKISKKSVAASAVALATSVSLATAPAASAQQLPDLGQLSSQANIFGGIQDQAWQSRLGLLDGISHLNNPLIQPLLEQAVDGLFNALFPGVIDRKNAEIRAEHERVEREHAAEVARQQAEAQAASARAEQERLRNSFNRGSCPLDADVCVDIDGNRSWLQDDAGNVTYVADWISSGARTPELATPRGTFYVQYKVKDEVSRQFGNAPMPYSVYFTNNGHAFHEGSPAYDSHGCVHLQHQDAVRYFDDLKVGDKVYIY